MPTPFSLPVPHQAIPEKRIFHSQKIRKNRLIINNIYDQSPQLLNHCEQINIIYTNGL